MQQIDFFSVRESSRQETELSSVSALFKNGNATDLQIEGNTLNAQYKVGSFYLILLTDNSPYEEALHIYLLGTQNSMLDQIHIGQPYTAGILDDLVCYEDTLEFSFFGNDAWRLRVLSSPRRMRPGANVPQVAIRWVNLLSKRYLELARIKP